MSSKKTLTPFIRPLHGNVSVPGSKSITNRIVPLAALLAGDTNITNFIASEDTAVMVEALRTFGISIVQGDNDDLRISGQDGKFPTTGDSTVDCKNSGTTMRFLTTLAALRVGQTILSGNERMHERPIADLVAALQQLGVQVTYLEKTGFPPIQIQGTESVVGGEISLAGNVSSQFLTALLLLAPFTEQGLRIKIAAALVSKPYVQMTLKMLERLGAKAEVSNDFREFFLHPARLQAPKEPYCIEPDATAATYPLALAAITGGEVIVQNLYSNLMQGDSGFSEIVLKKMGCSVEDTEKGLRVHGSTQLQPLGEIDLSDMPDAAMTAVILAAYAHGRSKITGLSTLRDKECDRIHALVSNLQKMGARVNSGNDFIEIVGDPDILHGAEIDTFDDHRVAMCFSVLGAVVPEVVILNPECVQKTYPGYWEDYEQWRQKC